MTIKNYTQALDYIHQFIPRGNLRFPGKLGLDRQTHLLDCLGNPQNRYPVIHIAGTSGKGSTVSYLSHLLTNHSFKVGLTVSPHIFDIRERLQVGNKLISQKDFVMLLNKIIPAIVKTKQAGFGNPTYFEIMVTLFYYAFYYYKVDFAVIETGLGGLMDGTNVVTAKNKIAVITKLGFDHTRILGDTLAKIAYQKAGIIHPRNTVLSLWQAKQARAVIDATAKKNHSPLSYIKKGTNFKNIRLQENGLVYDYSFGDLRLNKLFLNTIALYQVENSALALSAFNIIANRHHFKIDPTIVRSTLKNFKFPARMDIFSLPTQPPTTLIFDGAHNPQKMSAFIKSLKFFYPTQKFIFIVAFKQKKEAKAMLKTIIPMAKKIILTSFAVEDQDMLATSQTIERLKDILDQLNFSKYQVIHNPNLAVKTAIKQSKFIAATGSLYLLSLIYQKISALITNY